MIQSISPFHQHILAEFPETTQAEITQKIDNLYNTYTELKHSSIESRVYLLKAIQSQLELKRLHLAELISMEMGKNIKESHAEITKCISLIEFYIQEAHHIFSNHILKTHIQPQAVQLTYQPLGVIAGIMPWNFPFWQCLRFAIPTILAGNTIILKHASNVPQCAQAIADLFQSIDSPGPVLETVFVPANRVHEIIQHPKIQGVALTGSEHAGMSVAQLAAKRLIPSVLELGGNDPCIILPDADLDASLRLIMASRLNNNGQSCIGAKRIILPKAFETGFTEQLVEKLKQKRFGDPLDETFDLGTLVHEKAAIQLEQQVEYAKQSGAQLVSGGKRVDSAFFEPTVLQLNDINNSANQTELFGPVFSILSYNTLPEAIAIANSTPYGLGAMVMGTDVDRCNSIADALEVGSVAINDIIKSDPGIPFGGVKLSGYGREMGYAGAYSFTNMKAVRGV